MMSLPAGTQLGRYEIRSQLGAGGMGEVYLAHDTKLERTVALKILPADVVAHPDRMKRFVQEAKTASALNHPNIITIYEIDQADSVHFIAAEFVQGETLRQHMKGTGMRMGDVLNVAIQTADALSAAHEVGIIHRDIKPENIMLRQRDAYVKVLDFGLAKLTHQQPVTVDSQAPTKSLFKTAHGMVVGTVIYMSPEQARGAEVDGRTDIWSLGVMLYEMVAGCLPFEGSTMTEVLASILSDKEPPPLARFARDVPAELERIATKALRKEREQRYQTIKDLMLDLQSLKQKLEFEAKLERSMPPELKSAAAVAAEPSTVETITKPGRSSTSKIYTLTGPMKLRRRGVILAGAVLVLVAVTFVYALLFRNAPATSQPEIRSLAVLPLENLSGDPAQDYFADGMTEAVIAELAKISALRKVISRTSMMQYKGTRKSMPQIARELDVDALVEGSIVRLGDRVRITVKLYAAKDEQPLWTETYDRNLRDILALQSEVGRAIANEIKVKLTPQEKGLLANARPVNPEAHEAYLKGLQFFNQGINERREDLLRRSFEYLEQAIRIEPDYGLAHAQLARSYHWLTGWGFPEFYPKAKAEAIKALQIDDTLAQAHSALGFTIFRLDWDWLGAEREFKRAIELNPSYSEGHHAYALYLSAAGRHDEAIREIKRAQELDPLTLPLKLNVGITYLHARQYDAAIEQFRNTLDVNPDNPGLHTCLGVAYVYKGMYEEGIAEFQKVIALSEGDAKHQAVPAFAYALSGKVGGDPRKKANLAWAYAMSGKRAEAIKMLNGLKESSKQESVAPISVASIYAALGEKDQALEWLQKVYEDHSWVILYINCYPEFDSLRPDPRFSDLVRHVGVPQ